MILHLLYYNVINIKTYCPTVGNKEMTEVPQYMFICECCNTKFETSCYGVHLIALPDRSVCILCANCTKVTDKAVYREGAHVFNIGPDITSLYS